jgi:eukaryotic-like serine/threonine-protein kinase
VDPFETGKDGNKTLSLGAPGSGILPEGSRFGVYIVGPCIGHGGMARVYRAEHEGLRRSVALKVLHAWFVQDPEGHQRFLREARIAAAVKHPNVVNIFDVGVQDGVPYLVMELLEGEDLDALMHANGAMSESALVDIAVPIVAGLAAVHDAGVVHRDLKPGNIFLSRGRNGEVEPKLLDFGISRAAESELFKLTAAGGLLMGTPPYMSPEAIQGGAVTEASDQYSLGVVLYECSTGLNPFPSDTLAETVRRITSGDFPAPAQHNPSISKRMGRLIERAMSLDPRERFGDLREMGRELLLLSGQRTRITWSLSFGEVALKRTGSVAPPGFGSVRPPPTRQQARRGSIVAVLIGLLVLGGALALFSPSTGEAVPHGAAPPSTGEARANANRSKLPAAPAPPSTREALPADDRDPGRDPGGPGAGAAPSTRGPGEEAAAAAMKDEASLARRTGSGGRTEAAPRNEQEEGSRARARGGRTASPSAPPATSSAPPRPAANASDPLEPDWVSTTHDAPRAGPPRRDPTLLGTNNAPIFE